MAANYNRVILMGNLTRDPETQYLASGSAMAKFGIAVNRVYNDRQSGEKKEETCFVNITAFGRTAEVCQEYLHKGSPVFLEGRLHFHAWETDDGQKRSMLDVIADSIQLLPRAGQMDTSATSAPVGAPAEAATEDDIPF